jgi:hypothetical protein
MTPRRAEHEELYGPLWSGATELPIGTLAEVLRRVDLAHEAIRIIDAPQAVTGRYAVRFIDCETMQIICVELDEALQYLEESRVHVSEWLEEEI